MDTNTSLSMSSDQRAAFERLRLAYRGYRTADAAMLRVPYAMLRKTVGGRGYLYEMRDRHGNGRSLGRWSAESERVVAVFKERRAELRCAKASAKQLLNDASRAYRWSGLPLVDDQVGSFFRALEKLEIYGRQAIAIERYGDTALGLSAGRLPQFAPPNEVQMLWHDVGKEAFAKATAVTLRQIDPSFIVYSVRPFRARNLQSLDVTVIPRPTALTSVEGVAMACSDGRVTPIYYCTPAYPG